MCPGERRFGESARIEFPDTSLRSQKLRFCADVSAGTSRALPGTMNHRGIRTIAVGLASLGLTAVAGCAGYATVDGYDATYVDPPPPAVVATPTYRVNDGYVYEGGGRYYHMHAGRWVAYRHLPREAVRVNVEGRALRQRP